MWWWQIEAKKLNNTKSNLQTKNKRNNCISTGEKERIRHTIFTNRWRNLLTWINCKEFSKKKTEMHLLTSTMFDYDKIMKINKILIEFNKISIYRRFDLSVNKWVCSFDKFIRILVYVYVKAFICIHNSIKKLIFIFVYVYTCFLFVCFFLLFFYVHCKVDHGQISHGIWITMSLMNRLNNVTMESP